ncbi:molybdopterin-dependent oxidoreductase [Primorskyibacter sp. S87]|uniref:molybdopterin-dependent oxidoreductase n=1 Tax=Primorskyibacter sp. S87 TaxID=3415126 RepID=UPI003C7BE94D
MTRAEKFETRSLPSVCPLDCPDTCSLTVDVVENKLTAVRGSDANPYTAGVICNKVARSYPEFVHGPNRLTHPLKRVGPRGTADFERISWDEALDQIHAGFSKAIEQHGPRSVLPFNYAGPHGELAGGSMDRRFFYYMGATLLNRGPLCGAVRGGAYTSLFGAAPGMPPQQAVHSDLIVVWGNNVTVSNLHLIRVVKSAREQGAKLVVIDPKRIKIAEQSDLHVQIRPGTDVVLAMALAAELERRNALDLAFIEKWVSGFDPYMEQARQYDADQVHRICGVAPELMHRLADWIQSAKNMSISPGNGMERGRSGGSGLRAVMALPALSGHQGRRGAGVIAKSGILAPKTQGKLHGDHLKHPETRMFNIVDVPDKLLDPDLDPPVMATMIYNHNPVATHPNQSRLIKALMRDDLFIAGCDVAMTDSMQFCDVILPACSHFEHDDIFGAYGQNFVQRAAPVIPPVGESLPNTEIFRRLAARFGYDRPEFLDCDADLMDQAIDAGHRQFEGRRPSELAQDTAIEMTAEDGCDPIMCQTVFPATASGRIELFSADYQDRFGFGVPRYDPVAQTQPLALITPSSDKRTNATFGGCEPSQGPEQVEMNPVDAQARGLKNGDTVRVHNERGAVVLTLSVTDATLPGVLYSPKGTWRASSDTAMTVNALIPSDIRTDIENGACYHETYVDVEHA